MDHSLFSNWHLSRWIALLAGAFFAAQALYYWEAVPGVLGIFLLYQAITGSGCLGYGSCDVDLATQQEKDKEKAGREVKI
jgi:hypothetical protein